MRNARIHTATGYVKEYGYTDYTQDPTFNPAVESQVEITEGTSPPDGIPLQHVKVVVPAPTVDNPTPLGEFATMTAPEIAAVDLIFPVRIVQRKSKTAETVVTTGDTDAGGGWASVLGGSATCRPVIAANYQLLVSLDLSLVANAVWGASGPNKTAQARLTMDGTEIATWVHPFTTYETKDVTLGAALAQGAAPVFDIQIRRFGPGPASVRARRVRIEIGPTGDIGLDEGA